MSTWKSIDRGYEDILYHHRQRAHGTVARLTINRPKVHNAFTPKTVQELRDALEHARDLRLLGHDLRDEDRVGIARAPPRQVAAVGVVPGEDGVL